MSEAPVNGDGALKDVKAKFQHVKKIAAKKSMQSLDNMYGNVLTSPATVVILLIIISAFFAQQGMSFQDQIDDDVEIFLPDGAPSTELLLEVREEWSTDITIIYIKTNNADPTLDENGKPMWVKGEDNITDKSILEEISWVEGDDRNIGGDSISRGIDYDKSDHGRNDGVLWIISPAQIIKEINSADGRFNNSFCTNIVDTRDPGELVSFDIPCEMLPPGGEYAIPEQAQIDRIIEESNGSFDNLVKDRTVIVIAHRLSTIINSDKILVFENGSIIDSGAHDELINRSSAYKKLYNLQFKSKNE